DRKTKDADQKQKFEGAKNDRMTKASQNWQKGIKPKGPRGGTVTIGAKRSMKPGTGAKENGAASSTGNRAGKVTIGANRSMKPTWKTGAAPMGESTKPFANGANSSEKPEWKTGAEPTGERTKPFEIGANRSLKPVAGKPASMTWKSGIAPTGERAKSFAICANRTAAAETTSKSSADTAFKEKKNFRLGSAFQSTYDAKGNHKIRVLGFGVDRDSSGNTMAFKMPVMNMKVQRTDPNQSMKLARMHIPGIAKINSNVRGGRLQYSDVSILHGLGTYQKNAAGTHVSVAGIHTHKYTDGDTGIDIGKLHIKGGSKGDTVSLGSRISVKTTADGKNFQSVKLGSLEYTRSGIKKKAPQSGGESVEANLKSTKKPENKTKTGGDKA
ncbi:MAG: hypothetical protein IJ374_11250, partial [Lachnospiraceae bacterium]|nr:hypothetical protein [Lachnospiraceae bacterium]